jgi:hypothetical protein
LYSGIYSDTVDDIQDGGPTCYKEMTVEFRVIIALIMAVAQYFFQRYLVNRLRNQQNKNAKPSTTELEPSKLERFFGHFSIFIFALQMCYKFQAGKGVFMLNPCHVVLLIEAYIMMTKKTEKHNVVYALLVSLIFSPWCGIIFAQYGGLDGLYEVEMYWFEHILSALINPLILIIGGRYKSRQFFNFTYRLIGFAFFSLYHRLVLMPVAIGTWANLDQTLCHAETDPFYPLLGKWYYLGADLYLQIPSYLFAYSFLLVAEVIYYIMDTIGYTHNKKVKSA